MRNGLDPQIRIREAARCADRSVDETVRRTAADLLAVGDPPPLRAEALARIRDGVAERLAPRRWRARARENGRRWQLVVAGAVVFVLVSAMGAAAALWRYQRLEARRMVSQASAPSPAPVANRRSPRLGRALAVRSAVEDRETPLPVPAPEAAALPVVAPAVAAVPASVPVVKRVAPALSPAPVGAPPMFGGVGGRREPSVAASELSMPPQNESEARLLAHALAQLRQQHDPGAAIATLDRLGQAFPHGVLEPEALVTRIEAALAMNDLPMVTKLIETATPAPGRAGAALLVMRAELRARAGHCDAAARDFARVLDVMPAGGSDQHERALYGRAVCLGRLGQPTGARRDFAAYLRDYPNGRFSGEARRLLDEAPRAP